MTAVSRFCWFWIFVFVFLPRPSSAAVSAIWANSGDEKITRDDLRATTGSRSTTSTVWDGTTIKIFGGRNEVVSFNLVIEASGGASNVSVSLNTLTGPGSATIQSTAATGDGVFNWTQRNIELFYVRYVQVLGLSRIANDPSYDERLIPARMRRPFTLNTNGEAFGQGCWADRTDHDKYYPEIAVPMELVPSFNIASNSNQSVWVDIYIPKGSPAGAYVGTLQVSVGGTVFQSIPVQLSVRNFTLPDVPNAKTMLVFSSADINKRILGNSFPNLGTAQATQASLLRDRYFMLAHRHRISLIGDYPGSDCTDPGDQPCPDWLPRLNGSLFTAANGYAGPGVNTGNNIYSVGTYSSWSWKGGTQSDMWTHTNNWAAWFNANSPSTEYFLYLIDESSNYAQTDQWAQWIVNNPGVGSQMRSMATIDLPSAAANTPHLDIPTSTLNIGQNSVWDPLDIQYTNLANARQKFYMYNGHRPASGSFATEDDGVALREVAWGQYKKHIERWFYWQSTYYNDYQGGGGDTSFYTQARTYGGPSTFDSSCSPPQGTAYGQTTGTYGNGDGVLMYPGTDTVYPSQSYGINGPIASLRLKYWRRGIQDVDYLTMAAVRDPTTTSNTVNQIVPKALWEYDVFNPSDPTYQYTDISWPTSADTWENARATLASVISSTALPQPTLVIPSSITIDGSLTVNYPSGYNIASYQWLITSTSPVVSLSSTTTGTTLALTFLKLTPATYQISVTATDINNNVSPPATSTPIVSGLPQPALSVGSSVPINGSISATYPAGIFNIQYQWGFTAQNTMITTSTTTASATVNLSGLNLSTGTYQISLTVADINNNTSPTSQATVLLTGATTTPSTGSSPRAYPNPWRSNGGYARQMTFDQLPVGATLKIFTMSGHLVKTITASGTTAVWDIANSAGNVIASGLYYYVVTAPGAAPTHGKIAIIK